jgi:hypothetical protein
LDTLCVAREKMLEEERVERVSEDSAVDEELLERDEREETWAGMDGSLKERAPTGGMSQPLASAYLQSRRGG